MYLARTQSLHALPPQLLQIHLIRRVSQEVTFFWDAADKRGFELCTFFHNLLNLSLEAELDRTKGI